MDRVLGRYSEYFYALLRIIVGLLFASHGAQKVLGWFGGFGGTPGATAEAMTLMWWVGMIELVGGVLVAIGLLTSWAAFLCSGLMAFAYFIAHAPQAFFPIVNKGELAVIYCFLFLFVAARGSGPVSVDASRRRAD
jgi:putative oxidoreductase